MAGSGRVAQARARWWLPAALGLVLCAAALNQPSVLARPAAPRTVAAAPALSTDEAAFLGAINSLRASQGLSQLAVSDELTGIAQGWNAQMVAAGQISHNPSLGSQVASSWLKLGENVGVGTGVDGLMHAFIESPSHYQNIVDPDWTHVGVAVTWANDQMWTTHTFMQAGEQAPVVTAPPPTAAPVTTTVPPTTVAPETTTTAPPVTATPVTATPVAVPPTTEPEDEEEAPAEPPSPPPVDPSPERVTAVLVPLRSLGR